MQSVMCPSHLHRVSATNRRIFLGGIQLCCKATLSPSPSPLSPAYSVFVRCTDLSPVTDVTMSRSNPVKAIETAVVGYQFMLTCLQTSMSMEPRALMTSFDGRTGCNRRKPPAGEFDSRQLLARDRALAKANLVLLSRSNSKVCTAGQHLFQRASTHPYNAISNVMHAGPTQRPESSA